MNPVTQIQNLKKIVCISHNANTLGKKMNLTILFPMGLFNFGMATNLEKGKLWIKPVLHLKIHLVSHPTCSGEVG